MDERDWLILKVLFEKKNITKAAQRLFISQPSLTKKIQQIEREFETTIVQRGTRGVQFTTQGEYLAKCAEEMLVRYREIKETTINMDQEVSGTLRLGVSNYITRHKLPRLLKLFSEEFPKVNFKVNTGWSGDVFHLLANQEVHIGIVRGDYQWAGPKKLLLEESICVASKQRIDLKELPMQPRIDYETDGLLKTMINNWWSSMFTQPPLIGMEVDKGETCKEMVLNGLGYGILPSVLVDNLDLNRIELRDQNGDFLVRKTWMFYHPQSLEIKAVNEFVNFINKVDFQFDI